VNVDANADIAQDDGFAVTTGDLAAAGRSWFRLGAINDQTDLLENDLGVEELIFVNGRPIEEGVWFDGEGGGQFRVFSSGVVDFRNQGNAVAEGDTTGFSYGILQDEVRDTASVSLTINPDPTNAAPEFELLGQFERLIFEDDFERPDGPLDAPWENVNPGGVIEDGRLKVTSTEFPRDALVTAFDGDTSITNVRLKVDVDPVEFLNWTNASIMLRVDDLYWWAPDPRGDGIRFDLYDNVGGRGSGLIDNLFVHIIVDGQYVGGIPDVSFPEVTSPFTVEAQAIDDWFSFSINGEEVFSGILPGAKGHGGFSLFSVWEGVTYFDNVEFYSIDDLIDRFVLNPPASEGANVGVVAAQDVDGDPLVYAITGGNHDVDGDGTPAFAIDATTGVLTVVDSGDIDTSLKDTFILEISATDPHGLFAEGLLEIALLPATETDLLLL
jgi:hypothetical protein